MAFEPDKWADGEAGGTPITAAELNRIEAAGAAKALKGDTGDTGPKGDKGDQGEPGADGADGLGFSPAVIAAIDLLDAESTVADVVAALQA